MTITQPVTVSLVVCANHLYFSVALWVLFSLPLPAQDLLKDRQLRLITYNVQFLPSLAAWANKRLLPDYRATTMARAFSEYDIVGLNELFADEPRELLLSEMKKAWGDSLQVHLSPKVDKDRFPGGLAIISRLPFLETNVHTYTQYSKPEQFGINADGFVTKGILHARIATTSGKSTDRAIDVFVTHMEARDPKVRPSQYTEFADFVKQYSSPDRPAVLMGDFNTVGDPPQVADDQSAYNLMIGKFRNARSESQFLDLWTSFGKGPGGTSDQLREEGGRRIDYIFLLNPQDATNLNRTVASKLSTQQIAVNRFLDPKVIALSDHSAVEATVRIDP